MTPDSRLIMLMGLPRSGTTWLGKIFDSHPETFYTHEPDSASPIRDVPLLVPRDALEAYRQPLEAAVASLANLRTTRVLGKLPLFPKSFGASLPVSLRTQEILLLKSLSRFLGDLDVPRHVSGDPRRAARWVWKSIESSGRLGALARFFPSSRSIFILRHPCGVAASLFRGQDSTKFSSGPASEDYGFFQLLADTEEARSRGLTLQKFRDMPAVDRVAWRWALLNEKALTDIEPLDNCRVLVYEELCRDPLHTARELFDFAGIGWSDQTERFVSLSTSRDDASYYAVFKDPLQAANKWRSSLPRDVARRILEIASETKAGRYFADDTTSQELS